MAKRFRPETSPSSVKDTASRGSQTEPLTREEGAQLRPNSHAPTPPGDTRNSAPSNSNRSSLAKHLPPTPQSRLIAPKGEVTPLATRIRTKRTIPDSKSHYEGPTPQNSAGQFNLNKFAFGPIRSHINSLDEYNDDLNIEQYRPSSGTYSGDQRRGISEPFPNATTSEEHLDASLNASLPHPDPAPIHRDLERALFFNGDRDI